MKARATPTRHKLPETFEGLNALHPLRPINDRVDFENAQEVSDRLAVLDRRTEDQNDYLETLSMLMEKYESDHAAINTGGLDPVDTLRYLMDAHGMTASDLGRVLGERSLGAAVLRGDRQLSKAHIRALCAHFGVGPGLFFKL
jgi:HTH-type transcriptional regulator/antitoxin HigA